MPSLLRVPARWRPLLAVVLVAGVGAAWLHTRTDGVPRRHTDVTAVRGCGFRWLTGAPCPGCGMTRSLTALLRGDVRASVGHHPLGVPFAALALAVAGLAVAQAADGRPLLRDAAERHGPRVIGWTIALLAVVWLLRVFVRPDLSPDPFPPGSLAARWLSR